MSTFSSLAWAGLLGLSAQSMAQDVTGEIATVHIFGAGQTRQVQNLSRADLETALPGTSPLKILQKLPGVSFQSADVFGSYEWSTRINVRGFSQGQLGFTLDDIPLGNMSYGNNNGLHVSRAISPENLRRVDLSQGAGAVGTASTNNLGGAVQFLSSDPQATFGIAGSLTLGSNDTRRVFARIDSGRLASDTALYLSVLDQRAEKWKGIGPQNLKQFNSKLLQQFGRHQFSAFYNVSGRAETDYQDMSLDMQKRLGWDWDNYAPDWPRALLAARGVFSGGVNSLDDAYYIARGLRKDRLGGATVKLDSADGAWQLKATAYHHSNDGQGHWYTPYTPTSAAIPISIRTTEYAIARKGVLADLSWSIGAHLINGGFWIERNTHDLVRNFYPANGPEDTNYFLHNPMLTSFQQRFRVRTHQYYLQDTLLLLDGRLKLNAGFKSPDTTIDATSINAVRAAGTLKAQDNFLPQAGANFALGEGQELFATLARNQRAFEAGVYGQFSQNQAAFNANGAKLKPEESTSADLGLRLRHAGFAGSVALYASDFNNRLLSVATCAGVVGCPNTVVNVGKVRTRGLEAAASWAVAPEWSWFNALTLNRSNYAADYLDNGKLVPVSGKRVVDAPRVLASTELAWDNKRWFAKLAGKYTGKRYYTYVNDASVAGAAVWEVAGGYRFGDWTVQVHVGNLLGKHYFSTLGSNQFAASDPHGTFATLLTGAPRELFMTIGGKIR